MDLAAHLHPAGALRYIEAVTPAGKRVGEWFTDSDAAQRYAQDMDTRGCNVYWALGTFAHRTTRRISNLSKVFAVAFDIDVRAGNKSKHEDIKVALTALQSFITEHSIPYPTVVASGGGLHVYWTLTEGVEEAKYRRLARAMATAAHESGVMLDVGPSVNPVGLLRVPGTTNHKYPKPVKSGAVRPSTDYATLLALVSRWDKGEVEVMGRISWVGGTPPRVIVPVEEYSGLTEAGRLSPIMDSCAQVRLAPFGSEPVWRAGIQVVRLTEGGRDAVHEWSAQDTARYSEEVTNQKLDSLPSGDMPTTCERFDTINPGVCTKCSRWGKIKSPIILGRNTSAPPAPPPPPAVIAGEIVDDSGDGWTTPKANYRTLSDPPQFVDTPQYSLDNERFPCRRVKGEAETWTLERILEFRVSPVARLIGRGTDTNAIVWRVVSRSGVVTDITLDSALVMSATDSSSPILKAFGAKDIGVTLSKYGKHFAEYIRIYFGQVMDHIATTNKALQLGWDHAMLRFNTGTTQVNATGDCTMTAVAGNAAARADMMKPKGTIAGWRAVPDTFKQQDNKIAQFALLQSFASPLLRLAGQRGALVHLYSPESGTGKSTMLQAINSVWGDPDALMLSYRDTANATAAIFDAHGTLPVTLDELTNASGAYVSDLAFMVSQGAQKQRMTQAAELRASGTWSLIAVSTANESLRDKLSTNKRSDNEAENRRIIEFKVPPLNAPTEDKTRITAAMKENQGCVGEDYALWLVANRVAIRKRVAEADARIAKELGGMHAERFWVAVLAATEVACDITRAAGYHDFDWAQLYDWLKREVVEQQRKDVQESIDDHVGQDLIPFVREQLQASTLVVEKAVVGKGEEMVNMTTRPVGNVVAAKVVAATGAFMISSSAVVQVLKDHSISMKRWKAAVDAMVGWRVESKATRLGAGTSLRDVTPVCRCWCFEPIGEG